MPATRTVFRRPVAPRTIATSLRKDLARHRASLDRFKTRVKDLNAAESREDWQKLCAEAEKMLGQILEEEAAADEKLTSIALQEANQHACAAV